MKRLLIFCAALVLLVSAVQAGEKKALLIMLDGQRADALYSAPTPNYDSLRNGTWAEGYKGAYSFQAHTNLDSAPSSATNHVAIATGVTATKNDVYKNGQTFKGKYDQYPTWMQRLRKADPNLVTVWLYNWSEDGQIPADATYQNSRGGGVEGDVKIIDETIQIINGTFPDTPGVKDTKWTKGADVDAIMLYLDSLDMFGHRNGFSVNVDPYFENVTFYDEQIGKILAAIKSRPNFANEDWMIVVVADHGGIFKTHGVVGCKNCYTIPLIVSAKDIEGGKMAGQPQNCCSAAYLMKHMTGSVPEEFDGYI
ncbi:MAG: alkaline phosphatase family protein, partial [Thermoguttaceae bacterium]|nr:alkaline phosphatase family protein [Thermoguttaceae bacterium]